MCFSCLAQCVSQTSDFFRLQDVTSIPWEWQFIQMKTNSREGEGDKRATKHSSTDNILERRNLPSDTCLAWSTRSFSRRDLMSASELSSPQVAAILNPLPNGLPTEATLPPYHQLQIVKLILFFSWHSKGLHSTSLKTILGVFFF
ncbi:hypothetical protein BaRGS_00015730 [Batillaria attramentaria]|uniref:Uncharacterized protein n=1 Tax=Batillaria attramentaria TaxID=370345 RepID=A0ABD0L1K8_9CAEN